MGKQVGARICGGVAQLGEHLPCKQGVKSSNLSISIQSGRTGNGTQVPGKNLWFFLHLENCILKYSIHAG